MVMTDRQTGIEAGLAFKAPVLAVSTANVTLSGTTQTIDGVTPSTGERVLLTNQNTATENGVWTVQSSSWIRGQDFDGSRDVVRGTGVYVTAGSANSGKVFFVTSTGTNRPGTDSITFAVSPVLALSSAISPSTFMQDFLALTSGATALNYLGGAVINQANVNSSASMFLEVQSTNGAGGANFRVGEAETPAATSTAFSIGSFRFNGLDSGGNPVQWVRWIGRINDPATSTGQSGVVLRTICDGTGLVVIDIRKGLVVGSSVTGSSLVDQGFGTVNSSGFYLNNKLVGQCFRASFEATSGAVGEAYSTAAWAIGNLNTVSGATDGWALTSKRLTPPAGIWEIDVDWQVGSQTTGTVGRARLYNNTAAALIAPGKGFGSTIAMQNTASVHGRFVANGTDEIEVDLYTSGAPAQTAIGTGANELFGELRATRVG